MCRRLHRFIDQVVEISEALYSYSSGRLIITGSIKLHSLSSGCLSVKDSIVIVQYVEVSQVLYSCGLGHLSVTGSIKL